MTCSRITSGLAPSFPVLGAHVQSTMALFYGLVITCLTNQSKLAKERMCAFHYGVYYNYGRCCKCWSSWLTVVTLRQDVQLERAEHIEVGTNIMILFLTGRFHEHPNATAQAV